MIKVKILIENYNRFSGNTRYVNDYVNIIRYGLNSYYLSNDYMYGQYKLIDKIFYPID